MKELLLLLLTYAASATDWTPGELDELSYFTQRVLDYKPREQDILLRYDTIYERKIYTEPVSLLESEIVSIRNFHNFLKETNQSLPERFVNDPQRYDLRYLVASQFDFQQAYDRLVMRDKWLNETFPMPRELGFENPLHKTGSYYWMGRDLQSRPVAVVTVKNLFTKDLTDAPISNVLSYALFFYQYGIENFMVPG